MDKSAPSRSFVFAAVLAGALGLIVATAATALAPRIARNREIERQRNVLVAAGLRTDDSRLSRSRIEATYEALMTEVRVVLDDVEHPVYRAADAEGTTLAYVFPVEGTGLWGPIRGYLALDESGRRVRGVTFYEHKETPGLGAEISNARWTAQWVGKSVLDEHGELVGIRVKKGAVDPGDPLDVAHAVDGISGATITSRAVETLVRAGLERYRPYLEERWQAR